MDCNNIYYIHDNYGRPFKVIINKKNVKIYKEIETDLNEKNKYEQNSFLSFDAKEIFIGKSPLNNMTKLNGAYGPRCDGNTILINACDNIYVFISSVIVKFEAHGKIIEYVSPVGNNDMPYPYAVDEYSNTYLLIEGVVIKNNPTVSKQMFEYTKSGEDPYTYYYDYHKITADVAMIPEEQPKIKNFMNIVSFYIGNDKETLTYDPFPEKKYDELIPSLGPEMYFIDTNGDEITLTKEKYIDLLNSFGLSQSFEPIKNMIILE